MSSLIVEVCEIKEIKEHPNADKLELAIVKGWQIVVGKGQYKLGTRAVYAPIDSLIPQKLSDEMNVTKYLGANGRVRTAKLRGEYSQGLLIPLEYLNCQVELHRGMDVKDLLGIKKYVPPVKVHMAGDQLPDNPKFFKYTNIENIKNFPDILSQDEFVIVTEKIHGTNFRIAKIDGKLVVGSHNCNLKEDDNNIYWKVAKDFQFNEYLEEGDHIFGENYGAGIQKLHYNENKPTVAFFDLFRNNKYVDYEGLLDFCKEHDLPLVPPLYKGKFNKEIVLPLAEGKSKIADHIREGIVIKPQVEQWNGKVGRVIFKHINPKYLLKDYDLLPH